MYSLASNLFEVKPRTFYVINLWAAYSTYD